MFRSDADIFLRPPPDRLLFGGIEWSNNLRGRSHHEGTGWNLSPLRYERASRNDTSGADFCAIHEDRSHAHEHFVADLAGVEEGTMPHGDIVPHVRAKIAREMDDCAILQIGSFSNCNLLNISP